MLNVLCDAWESETSGNNQGIVDSWLVCSESSGNIQEVIQVVCVVLGAAYSKKRVQERIQSCPAHSGLTVITPAAHSEG